MVTVKGIVTDLFPGVHRLTPCRLADHSISVYAVASCCSQSAVHYSTASSPLVLLQLNDPAAAINRSFVFTLATNHPPQRKLPIANKHSSRLESNNMFIYTQYKCKKTFYFITILKMGLTRCYKTEVFLHLYLQFFKIFYTISIRYTRLRWRKSICILYFDEISQSTAKIKLLPVSDDGRPPYWNFTSGFDFDLQPPCMCSHWHVILRQPAKFRLNQTIGSGVMTSYQFFKMAAIESESYFRVQF